MSEICPSLIKQFCVLTFVYWNKRSLEVSELNNAHSSLGASLKYPYVVQTDQRAWKRRELSLRHNIHSKRKQTKQRGKWKLSGSECWFCNEPGTMHIQQIFLQHFTFHHSRCYILPYFHIILMSHIKNLTCSKSCCTQLPCARLWVTQNKMLVLLRASEIKGQSGLIWFAWGHIGSVELKDKCFMFHSCRKERISHGLNLAIRTELWEIKASLNVS